VSFSSAEQNFNYFGGKKNLIKVNDDGLFTVEGRKKGRSC
jgi:hypothetical protein